MSERCAMRSTDNKAKMNSWIIQQNLRFPHIFDVHTTCFKNKPCECLFVSDPQQTIIIHQPFNATTHTNILNRLHLFNDTTFITNTNAHVDTIQPIYTQIHTHIYTQTYNKTPFININNPTIFLYRKCLGIILKSNVTHISRERKNRQKSQNQ